jgi:NAD(P)-binding Rossmann-like domain
MGISRKQVLRLLGAAAGAGAGGGVLGGTAAAANSGTLSSTGQAIQRDVVIVGGGSAGTYTAVRLRDMGASVVVVERQARLGGHCETFIDPRTGIPVDFGVLLFENTPQVRDHFARFDVALAPLPLAGGGGQNAHLDLRTGAAVPNYVPPLPIALGDYFGIIAQFGALDTNYLLPDPVPGDLLAPFGDFVAKYALESIVQTISLFGQGVGDLLRVPALYVINAVGLGVTGSILTDSFLTTAQRNNSQLYEAATTSLGEDALLGTQILLVDRDFAGGVRVIALTPDGLRDIRARKLVFTAPPLPGNFLGFNLDRTERSLFAQYRLRSYVTALARLSGLPPGLMITNIGADTPYNLPPLPAVYTISPTTAPGLWNVTYGSPTPVSEVQARAAIAATIRRINNAGTYPVVLDELATVSSHTPYAMHVPTSSIAAGFYRDLYALQGRNRTYYTSAAFHSHNSSRIWEATEALLPLLAR